MDRSLIVLRHAKAATALGVSDAERPLTARGRRDAAAAGRELTAAGAVPELVLCSTARRTRETWQELSEVLAGEPEVDYDSRLYGADIELLYELIQQIDAAVRAVLLIGHNPALAHLVLSLTGEPEPRTGFPTAAFAVIGRSGEWQDTVPGSGRLAAFWTPKD